MMSTQRYCPDQQAQEALGAKLGQILPPGQLVFLEGDLGAGKTTLVRGLLRGLGHTGPVRSPTYTLLEPYEVGGRHVQHLDLYRLGDPEELEYLGLRELIAGEDLVLVEWPERGAGWLPEPDVRIRIEHRSPGRVLTVAMEDPGQLKLVE